MKYLLFSLFVFPAIAIAQNTFPTSGNAGIGTAAPAEKLEIASSGGSNIALSNIYDVLGQIGAVRFKVAGTESARIESERVVATNRLSDLKFFTGGSAGIGERLRLTGDGKIGFLTSAPTEAVQIGNPLNTYNYKLYIPGVYNFEQVKLGQYSNGSCALEFVNHRDVSSAYGIRLYTNVDQVPGLQFQFANPATAYNQLSYQSAMLIDLNGNVGINTLNTKGYKLAVNGQAIFSKVVVKNYDNWPDYVFDSCYQLPSLDFVSSFIRTNGHLPEIPSASTVEKEGHDIGELQKLLLKKMEEMTLYMIDLKKENNELKTENKMIRERLEQLEVKQTENPQP